MKTLFKLLFNIIASFVVGTFVAGSMGFNPMATSAAILASSFIPGINGVAFFATTADVSAITGYAGVHAKNLIGQFLNGLDVAQDVKVVRNVKTKLNLTKFIANGGLRPLNMDVEDAKNPGRQYTGRVLDTKSAMKIFEVRPQELRDTFMGEMLDPNAKDVPFAAWVWMKEFEKLASEVNDNCYLAVDRSGVSDWASGSTYTAGTDYVKFDNIIWKCVTNTSAGESPTTHPAKWEDVDDESIFDGLGTIIATEITATNITPVVTGSITSSNAYDKMKLVYRSLPTAVRKKKTKMWVSVDVFEKYCDQLETDFEKGNPQVIDSSHEDGPVYYLKGSAKKCQIVPATWMGTSQRIICSHPDNLLYGTNQLDDQNKIGKSVDTLHGFKAIVNFLIGFQIADLEVIAVNDQA